MDLISALRGLESSLKTHSSVTTVFREPSEQELSAFLREATEETHEEAWNSLVKNISALTSVNWEKDENDSTKNVRRCVLALRNVIQKDKSFPKDIFQTDENRILLENVAAMVNLFGVNCVIHHDISRFIDDNLDRL